MGSEETKRKKKSGSGGRRKDDGREQEKEQRTMITDERFASAQSDPRFMQPPKKVSKVEIDSRFSGIFTDRRFASSKAPVDKRGKPIVNKNNSDSSFRRSYTLEKKKLEEVKKTVTEEEDEDDDDDDGDSEAESQSESESEKLKTAVKDEDDDDDEEESLDESSSTDTTESDSEYEVDDDEEDSFMQHEDNIPEIDKETRRLALVNMDWSHVGAVDIYVLLSSFLPKGGQIMSVSVYPTEFGLDRMKEEAAHGPVGLFDDKKENEHESEEEDDEIDNKRLRAYELSRLRYYYAVVECDSIATADYLYKTCDGVEFERSANKLDLRFIPDSMDFKHKPRDVATEAPAGYEGLDFQTLPLQHSNVHISWDEDEPHRSKTLKKILNSDEPDESELNGIFASDESETDEDEDADGMEDRSEKKRKRRDMYLSLLQSGDGSDEDDEEDNDQDMEVTFNSGLEDISKRILEKKDKKSESVWEAHLKRRKEKKKAQKNRSKNSSEDESSDTDREVGEQPDDFFMEESLDDQAHRTKKRKMGQEITQEVAEASRAELELLLADDNGVDTNLKGFNLKPKKNKGKKGKENSRFESLPTIDPNDERFSVLLTNPLFALDPTDPQFKRSATYARQKAENQKMSNKEDVRQIDHSVISANASEMHEGKIVQNDASFQRKENPELSSLIRSIKMKSKQVQLPSEGGKVHRKHNRLQHKAKIPK